MAFYISPHEPLDVALKRIADERLEQSVQKLTHLPNGQQKAVHDTRKNFKRVRAVLRLMRDALGEETFQAQNVYFRDASRLLAPIRDSAVMVETLDLVAGNGAEFGDIRQRLVARHEAISQTLLEEERVIEQVVSLIENGRSAIQALNIQPNSFGTLAPSLKRVYRRGRKRMALAYEAGGDAEAFHDWRKRVKYLWYHLEILRPAWPSLLAVLIEDLHQVSDLLGDAHDMAELSHVLQQESERFAEAENVTQLLALLDDKQLALNKTAVSLGNRLYLETPSQFVARIGGYWEAWLADVDAERPFIRQPVDLQADKKLANTLLTTRDVAGALGMSLHDVRELIQNGRLPATKIGNIWVVRQGDLTRFQTTT